MSLDMYEGDSKWIPSWDSNSSQLLKKFPHILRNQIITTMITGFIYLFSNGIHSNHPQVPIQVISIVSPFSHPIL
jgi:hypothetical protein